MTFRLLYVGSLVDTIFPGRCASIGCRRTVVVEGGKIVQRMMELVQGGKKFHFHSFVYSGFDSRDDLTT